MRKKGFTLIELLAVIIILAVIALIATPVVLNIVENARRSAFQQSANGYYDAARYLYDELYLNNDRQDIMFTFEDGEQTSSNESYKLQVKGEKPKGGIVYLAEDGQIMVSIHNGKYCATTDGTGKVTLSEDIENCVQNISPIPESCFAIMNMPLVNEYGDLDYSEEWMSQNYNMLYYQGGEGCPTDTDILVIPKEVNGEKVEGLMYQGFSHGVGLTDFVKKALIIPFGVKVIDDEAFYIDESLTRIMLPQGLLYIGASAFGDNQLTNVTIPNTVTTIGTLAFVNNQLTNVIIPESVTSIGVAAFANNLLTDVIIPESVTTIREEAFANNQLTSVTIPNNVTSIERLAFIGNQLTGVTISSNVTTIGEQAFNFNSLTSITIPSSVTTIGDMAFYGNQLTSVTIPESVTTIGVLAFNNNKFPNASAITIEGDATRFDSRWTNIGFPAK